MATLLKSTCVHGPIGADIGSSGLRLVQLARDGGDLTVAQVAAWMLPVEDAAESPLPEAQVRDRLERLLHRPFRGREVVAALDVPDVELHLLELHEKVRALQPEALARAAALEIQRLTSLPAEDLLTAVWPLPAGRKSKASLMGVAGAGNLVGDRLDVLDSAGLVCTKIDVAACAQAGLVWLLRQCPRDQVWGLLDLGASRARLAVCIDDIPVLIRGFDISGRTWTAEIGRRLGLSPAAAERYKCDFGLPRCELPRTRPDAGNGSGQRCDTRQDLARLTADVLDGDLQRLVVETERSYEFVMQWDQQRVPGPLIMVGGGALLPGLDVWLHKRLGVDVQPLGSLDGERVGRLQDGLRGIVPLEIAALACGLSLQGLDAACPA
jgi:Tfp pilus assembly PilM family ATPase